MEWFFESLQENGMLTRTVRMPDVTSEMDDIAPCISPISIALPVPTAWLEAPIAMPWTTSSRIPRHVF